MPGSLKTAGLPADFSFYDLQHTSNQLAVNSGATTRELMHRMRDGAMRAALIYQSRHGRASRSIADVRSQLVDLGQTKDRAAQSEK